MFIKKVVNELQKIRRDYVAPRIWTTVNDVKGIDNKDDQRVIINDFQVLPMSGHAGIRRMVNNI